MGKNEIFIIFLALESFVKEVGGSIETTAAKWTFYYNNIESKAEKPNSDQNGDIQLIVLYSLYLGS